MLSHARICTSKLGNLQQWNRIIHNNNLLKPQIASISNVVPSQSKNPSNTEQYSTEVHHQTEHETSRTKDSLGSKKKEITIKLPSRIHREPTSILQALADTVNYDPTAFRVPIIDDFAISSTTHYNTRLYTLSEASGQNIAKYMLDLHPQYLQYDPSAPKVEAFTPKILQKGNNEDALQQRLDLELVKDAKEIYSNMVAEGQEVSKELKLQYLDTLCRYNCKDEDYYRSMVEQYFFGQDEEDHWRPTDVVKELFEELKGTYPQAYISMICGMCSYKNFQEAYELYNHALEDGLLFPIEVHNHILRGLVPVHRNISDVKENMERILAHLENNGIRPNLLTFNAILSQLMILPPFTDRYAFSLRVLKEMQHCGIEPSPATYFYVINMVYRVTDRTRYSDLATYLTEDLAKQKPIKLRDPDDNKFFLAAMNAAKVTNDVELAHRLFNLAHQGTNKALLGGERSYYRFSNNYMGIVIATQPIDEIMDVYNKQVPTRYLPDVPCWLSLFQALELYDGHHFIPQIYQDLKLNLLLPNNSIVSELTSLFTAKHLKHEVLKMLAEVAEDMYTVSLSDYIPLNNQIMFPQVFSNFIQLSLNMKDLDRAFEWFKRYNSATELHAQMNQPGSLPELAEKLASQKRYEDSLNVLHVLFDLSFHEEIETVVGKHLFPNEYREQVDSLRVKPKSTHQKVPKNKKTAASVSK